MTVRNINEKYGEAVEFDSIEEYADAIKESFEDMEDFESVEGVDYEIKDSIDLD